MNPSGPRIQAQPARRRWSAGRRSLAYKALLAVLAAFSLSVAGAASAVAQPIESSDGSFTIDSDVVRSGERLVLVGRDCEGDQARVTVVSDGGSILSSETFIVDPADDWAGQLQIPDDAALATYEVRALCLSQGIPFGTTDTLDLTVTDGVLPRVDTSTTTSATTTSTSAPEPTGVLGGDDREGSDTGAIGSDVDPAVEVGGVSVEVENDLALTGPSQTIGLSVTALGFLAAGMATIAAAGVALSRRRPLSAQYLSSVLRQDDR